jgi:hypothetical protein
MWILSFIPDAWLHYAVYVILISGISAYAISYIPLLPYKNILRIVGLILTVAGIYFYGSYETEMSWRTKTEEMQKEIDAAKVKSDALNEQIAGLIAQKTQIIHDKQIVIQKQIVEDAAKIDKQCVVDPEIITIINSAASGK